MHCGLLLLFCRLFAHEDDPDIDVPMETSQGHTLGSDTQGYLYSLVFFCRYKINYLTSVLSLLFLII